MCWILSHYVIYFTLFSTEHGIYEPQCGLDSVFMSWGHDGERHSATHKPGRDQSHAQSPNTIFKIINDRFAT